MLFTMVEALEAAKAPLQHVYFSQGIKYYVRDPRLRLAVHLCFCACRHMCICQNLLELLELVGVPAQSQRPTHRLSDADCVSRRYVSKRSGG